MPRGAEQGRVELSTACEAHKECLIRVTDNGCGICDEDQKKLFHAFFSTKGSGGTGVGLWLTARIVNEHGGRIEMQSEVGRGTTFCIRLPRQSGVAAAAPG